MIKKLNFEKLKAVVIEYPLVLFSSIWLFLYFYLEIDSSENVMVFWGILASSAISLFFGIKVASRKLGKVWWLRLIGVILLGLYYYILPKTDDDFNVTTAVLVVPIYILLHLFVAVAHSIFKTKNQISFWNYNKNLFVNIVTTIIFSSVLCAGVVSVLYTCVALFDLDIKDSVFAKIISLIFTLGNTLIFLLFVHKDEIEKVKESEFPVVLKFFTQFVLIPIMFLYTVVLYLYTIKILINWELPQGWLSYGILSYSIVGIFALLLVFPLRNETRKSWVRWFYNLFFYSIIPLIILLYVAIYIRIDEYGFTELRYFVLLLSIWLTGCTFYFIFFKKALISFIPKSLMIVIIFALACPYFNVFDVSIRSQLNEVEKILNENDLLKDGVINYNAPIQYSVLQELNDKYYFLSERNDTPETLKYLDEKKKEEFAESKYVYSLFNQSDFKNVIHDDELDTFVSESKVNYYTSSSKIIETKSNSWVYLPTYADNNDFTIKQDDFLIYTNRSESLKITLNDKKTIDFRNQILNFAKKDDDVFGQEKTLEEISFTQNLGQYKITVYLEYIRYYSYGDLLFNTKCIVFEELKP